jgi:hypothetical protein
MKCRFEFQVSSLVSIPNLSSAFLLFSGKCGDNLPLFHDSGQQQKIIRNSTLATWFFYNCFVCDRAIILSVKVFDTVPVIKKVPVGIKLLTNHIFIKNQRISAKTMYKDFDNIKLIFDKTLLKIVILLCKYW